MAGTLSAIPESCKHLKAECRPWDAKGRAFCPDCKQQVPLYQVFNNLLAAMREAVDRGEKLDKSPRFTDRLHWGKPIGGGRCDNKACWCYLPLAR